MDDNFSVAVKTIRNEMVHFSKTPETKKKNTGELFLTHVTGQSAIIRCHQRNTCNNLLFQRLLQFTEQPFLSEWKTSRSGFRHGPIPVIWTRTTQQHHSFSYIFIFNIYIDFFFNLNF